MHVKLSKGDAKVWIKFGFTDGPLSSVARRTTTIRLSLEGEEVSATAICSRKDNFCKRTGRKLALAKLLKTYAYTFANADDRRKMWQAVCPEFFKGKETK